MLLSRAHAGPARGRCIAGLAAAGALLIPLGLALDRLPPALPALRLLVDEPELLPDQGRDRAARPRPLRSCGIDCPGRAGPACCASSAARACSSTGCTSRSSTAGSSRPALRGTLGRPGGVAWRWSLLTLAMLALSRLRTQRRGVAAAAWPHTPPRARARAVSERRRRRTRRPSRADRKRSPFGEQVRVAEGRQRTRGIAHVGVAVAPQRADEQQLAPLQLGDREPVGAVHDVLERTLVDPSAVLARACEPRGLPSCAPCARAGATSLGVRSARAAGRATPGR